MNAAQNSLASRQRLSSYQIIHLVHSSRCTTSWIIHANEMYDEVSWSELRLAVNDILHILARFIYPCPSHSSIQNWLIILYSVKVYNSIIKSNGYYFQLNNINSRQKSSLRLLIETYKQQKSFHPFNRSRDIGIWFRRSRSNRYIND